MFEAIVETELHNRTKSLKKAYVEAYRSYSKLSREEKKTAEKPKKPALRKIKALDDLAKATDLARALQAKYDKGKER